MKLWWKISYGTLVVEYNGDFFGYHNYSTNFISHSLFIGQILTMKEKIFTYEQVKFWKELKG